MSDDLTAVRLFRATDRMSPDFGFGTCWAATLDHAQHYTRRLGFGGPAIYVINVNVKRSQILDLAGDPVSKMRRRGWDLYSQGEGEWLPGEIVRLGKLLGESWGHRSWLFEVDEPGVCWLYLGRDLLPAKLLTENA